MHLLRPLQLAVFSVCAAAVIGCPAIKVPGGPEQPEPLPVSPAPEDGSPETPGPGSPEPGPAPEGAEPDGAAPETNAPEGNPVGGACVVWQDCGVGDDNTNGFECSGGVCACDPTGTYAQNCGALGGAWDATGCSCIFEAVDVGGECTVWQDCPPGFESLQSGFECEATQCVCDPSNTYGATCANQGGFWVPEECFCVFSDAPPPSDPPPSQSFTSDEPPVCWWHYEQPVCDPDRYVDTSHYEQRCFYNSDDVWTCVDEYIQEGHYEPGACPPPIWDLRCL